MYELEPLKLKAEFWVPNLSFVSEAPLFKPLFPFPLKSFTLPLKGYQAINPEVGK